MTSACSSVARTGLMAEGFSNLAACQSCTMTSLKAPLARTWLVMAVKVSMSSISRLSSSLTSWLMALLGKGRY